MAAYVVLATFTDQGIKTAKESPNELKPSSKWPRHLE